MKKNLFNMVISFSLVLVLIFQSLTPVMAQEVEKNIVYIETEEDIRQLAQNCAFDTWSRGKTFVLKNNITLVKVDYLPIPTFGGTFEGNGNTISGVYVTESISPAGLFGTLQEDGVIQNLSVKGKIASAGEADNLGGIVGINYGNILNCNFKGYVKGESNIGGIAGINESEGKIRNCKFDGDVIGDHSTGGIAGWNKGIIFGCINLGGINIEEMNVDYEIPEISLSSIMNFNSTENAAVHTDTGGIAGFSEGKIYYSTNHGSVGYPHVGYNVGGIAGRTKQSYIQNCTNEGTVHGRKDVGGITGQIEPLLEMEYLTDKFQVLDKEMGKFLDLLEQTYSSVDHMGGKASKLVKDISYYVNTARVAAGGLSADSEEFYDDFNWNMGGINQGLSDLEKDLGNIDWETEVPDEMPDNDDTEDNENSDESSEPEQGEDNTSEPPQFPGIEELPNREDIPNADNLPNVDSYQEEINASKNAVNEFLGTTNKHTNNMNQSSVEYSEDMKYHMSAINANLEEAGEKLDELSDVLIQGGDEISQNMSSVIEQASVLKKVVNEIRNEMFQYEEVKLEDISDEKVSDEEIEIGAVTADNLTEVEKYDANSIQKGKLVRCLNRGKVEADINVGGIVGIMATEQDMDPEDDIEIIGDTSLNVSKTAKVVVRDNRNEGIVTAKKDCAGGIVGKMELGAVISCESYANVKSISGDMVGGIIGEAIGIIKNSYAKGVLSGKNYVGGIIGKGTEEEKEQNASTVANCYSMVAIEEGKQYIGAIAGNENGDFFDNYFVSDELKGINRVNYSHKAEPISYQSAWQEEHVPQGFKNLSVKFIVEGETLKIKDIAYGQTLSNLEYPEIPEKKGHYAVWDKTELKNLKLDTVVTAEYIPYITAVSSEESRENERPIFLAEGEFKEDDVIHVINKLDVVTNNGIENNNSIKEGNILEYWSVSIPNNTNAHNYVLHYLKDNGYKKVKIYIYENNRWKKIDYEEEGSYYLFNIVGNQAELIVTK